MLPAASWRWWECLCLVTTAWPEDEQGFIPGQLPLLLGGPRAGQKKSWIGWTKPHTNTWWVINDIALQPTMSWFKQKLQRRFAVISVIVTPVAGSLHGGWRVDILNTSAGPGRWRWEEETSTKAVLLVQAVVRRRPRPISHLSISLCRPARGEGQVLSSSPAATRLPAGVCGTHCHCSRRNCRQEITEKHLLSLHSCGLQISVNFLEPAFATQLT